MFICLAKNSPKKSKKSISRKKNFVFAISNMTKNHKNAISRKKDDALFDFMSFLAWTFLNFMAHCCELQNQHLPQRITSFGSFFFGQIHQ